MPEQAYSAQSPRQSQTTRFEDLTAVERAEIAAAWERGAKWSDIAVEWNVSRWTVDLVRESAGLPLRGRHGGHSRAARYLERTGARP